MASQCTLTARTGREVALTASPAWRLCRDTPTAGAAGRRQGPTGVPFSFLTARDAVIYYV